MKECPKCFASLDQFGPACSSPHCARGGYPLPAGEIQYDAKGDPVCPACNSRMTLVVCTECGFAMDAHSGDRETVAISMVGEQSSGKSCMLATMIQQMGSEFGRVYNTTLYPADGDRTMALYEQLYYKPIYEQGACVPPTEPDLDPLTYTLVFGEEAEQSMGLTFYDTCGETFESEQQMARYNRSLYHSNGLLFLIDPMQFAPPREVVRAMAKGGKIRAAQAAPQPLLLRTVHQIRAGLSLGGTGKKIPIPIAVCLTKMDLLFPHLDKASFLGDPSRHMRRPMMSAADLSSCNRETQSLIESWGGREFIAHVKSQFAESCFFGVSALGGQPGEQNEIPRVAPHRVLDPLLWLLSRKQVVKMG